MAKLRTKEEVELEELQRRLSDELGPRYRVTVASDSSMKVGRPGVVPSRVRVTHSNDGTTLEVRTSGLIVSRVIQAASINPRVRRALAQVYRCES